MYHGAKAMSRNAANAAAQRDAASFRDPGCHVYHLPDGRVLRGMTAARWEEFLHSQSQPALQALVAEGKLIASTQASVPESLVGKVDAMIEHPRIDLITYPYEWTFGQLKQAALLQLHIQRRLLPAGLALSDASAYNIQFIGHRPLFIDRLSVVPYRPGELWRGHGQFVSHYLVPLLLGAQFGMAHAPLFLAYPEGLPAGLLHRLTPWHRRLSFRYQAHIALPLRFTPAAPSQISHAAGLSAAAFDAMLQQLERWIESLDFAPPIIRAMPWDAYYDYCHYEAAIQQAKRDHVARIVAKARPARLLDLGGNDGSYSALALENGAGHCLTIDSDHGASSRAFARCATYPERMTSLFADLCQPSPGIGWAGAERLPLLKRLHADMLLALGLIHHLTIARAIPLDDVLATLLALAPEGIIEWVDTDDAMSQRMLASRDSIPALPDRDMFEKLLSTQADIHEIVPLTPTRYLIHYRLRQAGG